MSVISDFWTDRSFGWFEDIYDVVPQAPNREGIESIIETLLALLDAMDGDPALEDNADYEPDADDEPDSDSEASKAEWEPKSVAQLR